MVAHDHIGIQFPTTAFSDLKDRFLEGFSSIAYFDYKPNRLLRNDTQTIRSYQ